MPALAKRSVYRDRHVLHPAIAMVDQAAPVERLACAEGLLQRIQDEVGAGGAGHLPADDVPGEPIDDEGHIDEPLRCRHIREIRDPQGIRTHRRKRAVDPILRTGGCRVADRGFDRLTTPHPTPFRPSWRISRSTVQRATSTPSRRNCRQTLSAP